MMNKLKRQRKSVGLTQHELSREAKIPPGRIAWAETGRTKLRPDEAERVKQVLARRAAQVAQELSA
jgi:transcriptional regulator with XRE-family HTH domain